MRLVLPQGKTVNDLVDEISNKLKTQAIIILLLDYDAIGEENGQLFGLYDELFMS